MLLLGRHRRAYLGLTAGLIAGVDFLANSTVNFAETPIRDGLGVTADVFLWVLTAYAAAGALMILLFERLSRAWRFRSMLLAGLGLFVAGSVMAMCSESVSQLVFARVVQGLGGGALMTCTRVLLQVSVPPESRRQQLQGFMLGIFISAAPGPWVAAWLMQQGNWHALFLLHALFGAVVMLLCYLVVPKRAHVSRSIGNVDLWAALAFCLGSLLWLHTLQDLRYERPDGTILLRIALALGLFVFLFWRLVRHPDPWFNLHRLSSRRYLVGLLFYFLYYLINGALGLLLPLYLLKGEGFNLETAGRLLTISGLCTVLALPLYFRLAKWLPDRRLVIMSGFVMMALLLFCLGQAATGETPDVALLLLIALKGLFPILVVIQVAGLAFREFKHQDFVHAYALKNILRLLANAVGACIGELYWQDLAAERRVSLLTRVDLFHSQDFPFSLNDHGALSRLSQLIDQRAELMTATQVFSAMALVCLLFGVLIMLQKALR
jgi:DHA2 family multidrug resistance protein